MGDHARVDDDRFRSEITIEFRLSMFRRWTA